MSIRSFFYGIAMWLILALLAIANGSMREFGIKKFVSDPWSNHISVFTGIMIFFTATFVFFKLFSSRYRQRDTLIIGSCWVALTVAFEFLFGHYVVDKSWEELFQQYNLASGNLWVIALASIGLSPWLAFKLTGKNK